MKLNDETINKYFILAKNNDAGYDYIEKLKEDYFYNNVIKTEYYNIYELTGKPLEPTNEIHILNSEDHTHLLFALSFPPAIAITQEKLELLIDKENTGLKESNLKNREIFLKVFFSELSSHMSLSKNPCCYLAKARISKSHAEKGFYYWVIDSLPETGFIYWVSEYYDLYWNERSIFELKEKIELLPDILNQPRERF